MYKQNERGSERKRESKGRGIEREKGLGMASVVLDEISMIEIPNIVSKNTSSMWNGRSSVEFPLMGKDGKNGS